VSKKHTQEEQQEAGEPVVIDRRVHVDETAEEMVPLHDVAQNEAEAGEAELEWAAKAAELQDMLLRREADLQNQRKRHIKDMENARRFAVEALLADLFPALDGLAQAASEYGSVADGENALLDGLRSTVRIIDNALGRHGISKISEAGVAFDSELHQPLSVEESREVTEETVGQIFVEGYRLGETVLKPAMVQVLRPQG
jgi:molecular chaperone GrpE